MRALYEINAALEALLSDVDEETGEVGFSAEQLDALVMEREEKIENLALAIKNMAAEAAAIKAEEDSLKKRRKALENKTERIRDYLQDCLAGDKFKTPRVAVSYRKSTTTEITDEAAFWEFASEHPQYYKTYDPEPDKKAIMETLKTGESVPGAELVDHMNMQIR